MPQHLFWGEILNALIGFDPTAPLPVIERTTKEGESSKDLAQNKVLKHKKKLSDQDAEFTPLLSDQDISEETLKELLSLTEGDHEFTGAKNPLTTEDIQNLQGGVENKAMEEAPKEGAPDPDFAHMSDDDKLNYYLDQMRQQMQQPKDAEKDKKADAKATPESELPDVANVGPLAIGQRVSFITEQMKIGIEAWWSENKGWVIPTVIGVVLGVTALIVLTGGAAIMPVLTALMQGLTVVFGAMLIAQIAAPLKDYIVKAWNNDVTGASKSLAQAFAVGLVEIIFNLIFKGLGKLFKLIGKGAKAAIRGMKKLAQGTARFTKRLGAILLRNGKVIFQGLKKGALKGSKSVGSMIQKLGRKFRFKKLTIKRTAERIDVYGEFNPRVLVLSILLGRVTNHKFRPLGSKLRKEFALISKGGRPKEIGALNPGKNKIIVTDDFAEEFAQLSAKEQNEYIKRLRKAGSQSEREEIIRELGGGDKIPAWAKGTDAETHLKQRGKINTSYKGDAASNENLHHLIAIDNLKHPVVKKGVKGGLKAGAKAVKNSAVRGVKNTAKSFKELGGVAKEGGQALVKNGKMVFQGIKRGAISGAKTLDDVAQGLAKRFRFKIRVKGRKWQLLGEFNPYVVVMEGDKMEMLHKVDDAAVAGKKYGDDVDIIINGKKVKSKYVSDKDTLHPTKEDYVKFWERATGKNAKGNTLHHLYEKAKAPKYAPKHFTPEFIHSPKHMRPIPSGIKNSVVHLSHIRTMWNRFYTKMDDLIAAAGRSSIDEAKIISSFNKYMHFTDEFIEQMLKKADDLEKAGLSGAKLKKKLDEESIKWLKANNETGILNDTIDLAK